MIDKQLGGTFNLYCDICHEEADVSFTTFAAAVRYKKTNSWKSQKSGEEWKDVCPDCQ